MKSITFTKKDENIINDAFIDLKKTVVRGSWAYNNVNDTHKKIKELLSKDIQSKNYTFRLFGVNILLLMRSDGVGWIRIFGRGIHWKDITKHRLYFSERNGYGRLLKIGKWTIKYLPSTKSKYLKSRQWKY